MEYPKQSRKTRGRGEWGRVGWGVGAEDYGTRKVPVEETTVEFNWTPEDTR